MKVLGIEKNVIIDFKDKTGRQVHLEGLRLHLGEERKGVEGIAVDKPVFVNNEKACYPTAEKLKVGDVVALAYNRFGTFDSLYIPE